MKISLTSDVHLEFGAATIENKDNADVLILAGDILIASDLLPKPKDHAFFRDKIRDYDDFIEQCSSEFDHVIMICGNHEHYTGNVHDSCSIIKERYSSFSKKNFTILNNEKIEIDGIDFLGGTCWTNMNNDDPITKITVRQRMNDFQLIYTDKKETCHFSPDDAIVSYHDYVSFLSKELEKDDDNNNQKVIISHHPPSKKFVHPKYIHEPEMNGAYCNDLDDFILDHQNEIAAWVCGHVHNAHSEQIGNVPVYANPRGYYIIEHFQTNIDLLTFETNNPSTTGE